MTKVIKTALFFIGLGICFYPLLGSVAAQYHLDHVVDTYKKKVKSSNTVSLDEYAKKARAYNEALFQSKEKTVDGSISGLLDQDIYQRTLCITETGIMGSIEIPKISVNLPIYHGTEEEVLAAGVGHVEGTSLPIGGTNTRTVLSGHRGLPNSKLFTRLDELELGDLFYLKVLDEVLAYEVIDIDIIEPDETDVLSIVPEKDLATLVTCTPYGMNTHRLIVTGERRPYIESEYQDIEPQKASMREMIFAGVPCFFACLGMSRMLSERRKQKRNLRTKGGDEHAD